MAMGKLVLAGTSKRVIVKKPARTKVKSKQIATKGWVNKTLNKNYEQKYIDVRINQTYDVYGLCTSLTDIPQDASDSGRIGDKVCLKSMQIALSALVADVYNNIRFIVFRWHEASTPTVSQVIQTVGYAGESVHSPLNHDYRNRFTVLLDHNFVLDQYSKSNVMYKKRKRLNCNINYSAGSTSGTGKIYMLGLADSSAAPNPGIVGFVRFNYTD